jgi:serine/threonine protein kinase
MRETGERQKFHCILKITDVGLSKSHKEATKMRSATRTNAGTIMYEPPEATETGKPRSRRYDIWSMGCIYLEFLIWLLYGAKGLKQFGQDISKLGTDTGFYDLDDKTNLNSEVQKWIEHIEKDPRCPKDTALQRLLEVIVGGLLVSNVDEPDGNKPALSNPKDAESTPQGVPTMPGIPSFSLRAPTFIEGKPKTTQTRWDAKQMHTEIRQIFNDATCKTAWMNWAAPPQDGPGMLLAPHSNTKIVHQNRQVC